MTKKHIRLINGFFAAFFLLLVFFYTPNRVFADSRIVPMDAAGDVVRDMMLPVSAQNHETGTLVSAAAVDATHIAFVDYSNLYCFDTESASTKLIRSPFPKTGPIGKWVPTGLTYSARTRSLYIANYTGDNIIEGILDCAKGGFTLKSVISSPNTVSPENVAIDADGKILVSAQYDGGTVTAFKNGGAGWKPIWTAKLPFAHGVAIVGQNAYATSLSRRTINKFDLQTGKLLKTAGQIGANPLKTDLMWPTGLTNFGGTLVLSDAHTGFVCSIDPETLDTETCIGGQGDGPQRFNMPYGVAPLGKNLLILSTFSSRVAEVQADFARGQIKILHDWYWTGNRKLNREFTEGWSDDPLRRVAFASNPYSTVCLMPAWLPGMTCAYAGVVNRGQTKFLRFPTANSIFEPASSYYFIKSFHGQSAQDVYFYSSQSADVVNLRLVNGVPYFFMRSYTEDLQSKGNKLVSPSRSISKDKIRSDFDSDFVALNAGRNKSGIVPIDAVARLMPGWGQAFRTRLKASIAASKSALGMKFLADYEHCAGDSCDGDGLRKDAIDYATQQLQARNVLLDRVIVPCMLTNAQCGPAIWKALINATPNR